MHERKWATVCAALIAALAPGCATSAAHDSGATDIDAPSHDAGLDADAGDIDAGNQGGTCGGLCQPCCPGDVCFGYLCNGRYCQGGPPCDAGCYAPPVPTYTFMPVPTDDGGLGCQPWAPFEAGTGDDAGAVYGDGCQVTLPFCEPPSPNAAHCACTGIGDTGVYHWVGIDGPVAGACF